MASLSAEQLKTLAPTTDALVTKIPAILKPEHSQYSDDSTPASRHLINTAPKAIVNQVFRGEIIVSEKKSHAASANTTYANADTSARLPIPCKSSVNGSGTPEDSLDAIRKKFSVLGIAEADASFNDGENFPIIAKGVMSVPTISIGDITKGSIVMATLATPAEIQRYLSGRPHPFIKEGKRTFMYKSVKKSDFIPNVQKIMQIRAAADRTNIRDVMIQESLRAIENAETVDEKVRATIKLSHALSVYALEEQSYVIGEALTGSKSGYGNSFDIRIDIG